MNKTQPVTDRGSLVNRAKKRLLRITIRPLRAMYFYPDGALLPWYFFGLASHCLFNRGSIAYTLKVKVKRSKGRGEVHSYSERSLLEKTVGLPFVIQSLFFLAPR